MERQNNTQPDNGAHSFTEALNPWSFCETPEEKCTMNYCDENGCMNRKRELVEAEPDPTADKCKLISMTDFVIQKRSELLFKELGKACCKYANFLKQPLTVGMFVPCDDEGNVLDKPQYFEFHQPNEIDIKRRAAYQKANEKVLFEGFMNIETRKKGQIYFALKQSHRKSNIDHIMNDAFGLFFYDASNEKSRLNTVEDLLDFHPLQLTPTALKQFQQ